MLGPVVTALLTVLQALAPALGTSSSITTIINALIEIIPLVAKEFSDVLPMIKNIISALQANATTNAEQLATLAALDAQVDTAFEAAANAAESEDAGSGA